MNWAGFGLVVLTIVFVACQFVAHRWIKKVTNCYFFWLAIGAFCFIWLMVFRFAGSFSRFWGHGPFSDPSSYDQSFIISGGLLLDLCPFCGFFMPILLMVDPTRKTAKLLAPISLLAGIVTVGSFVAEPEAVFTASYIFIGTTANPCYFIMHFLQIVLGIGVMLNSPRYGWRGVIESVSLSALIYTYVGICRAITGAAWFVSGLSYNDWSPGGEYFRVAQILHWSPKVCPYIGIPILNAVGVGLIALKDFVFNRGWFRYGNKYSGIWYQWYNYNIFVKEKWF